MDLIDFVNQYWTILAGIASFVGVYFYTQFKVVEFDKKIIELEGKHNALSEKFELHKDKITDSINLIQQDIREIMTILKQK